MLFVMVFLVPKVLKDGDIINIDITVIKDGYHGDTSKMFHVGKTSILAQRLVENAREAMLVGIALVKPGVRLGDIGHAIQQHGEKHGFLLFVNIVVMVSASSSMRIHKFYTMEVLTLVELRPGMTFTIEPMINAGKRHVKQLADGWTVVTKDRSLSAQWEHTILVTNTGHEILTLREEESYLSKSQ